MYEMYRFPRCSEIMYVSRTSFKLRELVAPYYKGRGGALSQLHSISKVRDLETEKVYTAHQKYTKPRLVLASLAKHTI
jgi:hypothetical protein